VPATSKYQQSLVNLLKDAAKQPDEAKTEHADEAPEPPAPSPPTTSARNSM
jgi:hypothetical protein